MRCATTILANKYYKNRNQVLTFIQLKPVEKNRESVIGETSDALNKLIFQLNLNCNSLNTP
jgi:hypothetical protein